MIRTNLATKPFYNERAVHLALLLLGILVVAASVFNVTRILQLSHSGGQLASQASRQETRAAELHASAAELRSTVDPKQIELVSTEARRANDLIDRRTFSWTDLLNRFETTLPDEAHITSIRPKVDPAKGTLLTITVVARNVDEVYHFMQNLEKSGAFSNLNPREDHFNDQGLYEAILEARYAPAIATRQPVGQP